KMQLMQMAGEWSDSELMFEIMNGAPKQWRAYIDVSSILTFRDFQDKIKWHEEDLMSSRSSDSDIQHQLDRMMNMLNKLEHGPKQNQQVRSHQATSQPNKPVGWRKDLPKPQFQKQKDDRFKGPSPKDKGARACKHCGGNHWDKFCPKSAKGYLAAKANMANTDDEGLQAELDYEDLQNEALLEAEDSEDSNEPLINLKEEEEQDFHNPLKSQAAVTS
ncbi:hypothetical protein FRC06_000481, partial [Ceratobasidium sp. 370]